MNVKPIPNELLGDSLTLIVQKSTGFTETPIDNVRVEREEDIEGYSTKDSHGRVEITVWIDYRNSTWTDFPVGAKVRYKGELFEIAEQKIYRAGEPHHCKFRAIKIGDE